MSAVPILSLDDALEVEGEAAVRRAARASMWREGDLSYRFSDLQLRVREMLASPGPRRAGWLASRRAGKSRTACGVSTEKAYAMPGLYIPYAAPSAVQVRSFVDPHFRRIANEAPPDLAMDQADGRWVTPPLQWYDAAGNPVRTRPAESGELARFSGGKHEEKLRQSIINPRGCEDTRKADALRGPGTAFAVVDEARDIPILDYVLTDVLGPMLWEARAVWGLGVIVKLFVCTTAPRRPDHAFVDVWEALKATGAALHSTIYDADHLNEQDIAEAREEAGGENTSAWRREALAIIERDPTRAVFPEFSVELHIGEVERPSAILPAVIGDGGFVDRAVYAFGYFHFELLAYVIEAELVFQRTRSDEQDRQIAALERELWPGMEVERRRVDAPPQVRADMNREEWGEQRERSEDEPEPPHWHSVTKPRSKSEGSMQAGVNRVRVELSKPARVIIHPRCETIIAHADAARWNTARTEFVRVRDEDGEKLHHYDGAAALVYFVRDVNAHDNPIPQVPAGVGLPTHMIREHRLRKTTEDKIRELFRGGSPRRRRRR